MEAVIGNVPLYIMDIYCIYIFIYYIRPAEDGEMTGFLIHLTRIGRNVCQIIVNPLQAFAYTTFVMVLGFVLYMTLDKSRL